MSSGNQAWMKSGIDLVDTQHEEYFRRLDILLAKIENSELNGYELRKSLDFFRSYAVVHFDTEELLMRISSYPEAEEHMKTHAFFTETIERMAENLNASENVSRIAGELKFFLSGWLEEHIKVFDLKMADFLRRKVDAGGALNFN